jgi:hypothetical protein
MIKEESQTIVINPSRRILKMPGALCGGISTGTDKIRSGFGNGDCLYFDFEHLVFAVADGSERFPWASRDLLNRMSESLSRSGSPDTVDGWKDMMNREIYSGQKYQHKTTFSCVAIKREGDDIILIISHGGDSAVTVMNSVSGSICRQTRRDMNFAGRSKEIVDVTQYRAADRDSRVLLSTDGFDDVWRFCLRQSLLGGASDVFMRYQIDGICEMIHGVLEENKSSFEYDDIGLIIIDPFRVEKVEGTAVLMGGTRPHEEKRFQEEYLHGSYDQWISGLKWNEYGDIFAGAGIQIQ